jgi:hypothetical protein
LEPVAPTNALIPFEADADGRVKTFNTPVDTNKVLSTLATTQQSIAQTLTGGGTTTTGGTTGGMSQTTKTILWVVGGISVVGIVGYLIYKAVKK